MVDDVTPTAEDYAGTVVAIEALAKDIHDRWPIWIEMAKPHIGKWSSPYMVVAGYLMMQGMSAMLEAQILPADVMKCAENMFDLLTDPNWHGRLAELRDDKAEILAFIERMLMTQAEDLAKQRTMN